MEDVFYKPKGQILIGASARGYKFGSTVVRRACVTVAGESESPVTIEALDPVTPNVDTTYINESATSATCLILLSDDVGAMSGT